jgi:hypothetical protein
MSERDRITRWQNDGAQTRWPCGDDPACLVTASPDLPGQPSLFAHSMPPAPICPFRLAESTMGLNEAGAAALHARCVT